MKTNGTVCISSVSTRHSVSAFSLLAAVLSVFVGVGCGGGSSSSSSTVPASVVQDVATMISDKAVTNLAEGSGAAIVRHPAHLEGRVEPQEVSCNQNSCVVSQQYNVTDACQYGGTAGFAGDVDGSVNSSGTGSIQFQVNETFTNCVPVSGYTVNGAPEVTIGGTFTFNNGSLSFPLQILAGGAVTINGNNCNINLTTLAESNGSSTTTGTLCGQSVNVSVD
jgi:hypothetical protein